jgi:hypothetical protein
MATNHMKMDMQSKYKYYISHTPHRKGYCHTNKDGTVYTHVYFSFFMK